MLLGIDVGNTNTVIGALEGLEVQHLWRVSTIPRTTDEFGLTLIQLLKHEDMTIEDIEGVAVCCVVPSVLYAIEKAVRRYLKCDVLVVGRGIKTGMRVRTESSRGRRRSHRQRIAAFEDHGGLVVVDFGAATTFASAPGRLHRRRGRRATNLRGCALHRAPQAPVRPATGSGHRHEHRREHAVGSSRATSAWSTSWLDAADEFAEHPLRGHGKLARLIGGACDEIDVDEHLTLKGSASFGAKQRLIVLQNSIPFGRSGVPSGHGHPV